MTTGKRRSELQGELARFADDFGDGFDPTDEATGAYLEGLHTLLSRMLDGGEIAVEWWDTNPTERALKRAATERYYGAAHPSSVYVCTNKRCSIGGNAVNLPLCRACRNEKNARVRRIAAALAVCSGIETDVLEKLGTDGIQTILATGITAGFNAAQVATK